MTKLPYRVEVNAGRFYEVIAAFDCQPAAVAYAKECESANAYRSFKYRVRRGQATVYGEPNYQPRAA